MDRCQEISQITPTMMLSAGRAGANELIRRSKLAEETAAIATRTGKPPNAFAASHELQIDDSLDFVGVPFKIHIQS